MLSKVPRIFLASSRAGTITEIFIKYFLDGKLFFGLT